MPAKMAVSLEPCGWRTAMLASSIPSARHVVAERSAQAMNGFTDWTRIADFDLTPDALELYGASLSVKGSAAPNPNEV